MSSLKIDPTKITDYNRTDEQLQAFWLFCLAVAGKKATMMAQKVDEFLNLRVPNETPYDMITRMDQNVRLVQSLRAVKMGKYALLEKGYKKSASQGPNWLRTASADTIRELIPGAGYKTSRFFTLHSRQNEQVAVIDTHMLKFLKHVGYTDVPSEIPTGQDYLKQEKRILDQANLAGMTPADYDLTIWNHYSSGGKTSLPAFVPYVAPVLVVPVIP